MNVNATWSAITGSQHRTCGVINKRWPDRVGVTGQGSGMSTDKSRRNQL
jgi:hypothetical protein